MFDIEPSVNLLLDCEIYAGSGKFEALRKSYQQGALLGNATYKFSIPGDHVDCMKFAIEKRPSFMNPQDLEEALELCEEYGSKKCQAFIRNSFFSGDPLRNINSCNGSR